MQGYQKQELTRSYKIVKGTSALLGHSFLNERTGLPMAAFTDCHAIVANAMPSARIPASTNTAGPIVMR